VIDPPTDPSKYFPLDPESEQWKKVWGQIEAIDQLAKENHARFVLLIFPLEFQVLDERFSTLPQELLTAKAAEVDMPVLNLLPAFQRACRQKPGGACQLEDRYLFADVWMHPSAFGDKVTATELGRIVEGMLPK
jgi:hypothetical protein